MKLMESLIEMYFSDKIKKLNDEIVTIASKQHDELAHVIAHAKINGYELTEESFDRYDKLKKIKSIGIDISTDLNELFSLLGHNHASKIMNILKEDK